MPVIVFYTRLKYFRKDLFFMSDFKKGKKLKLVSGEDIEIVNKIGEGGQGVVYKVRYQNKEFALKWYFSKLITNQTKFYNNLVNNVVLGSPAKEFLWPLAVTEIQEDSFGYIMELRPLEYKNFAHFLNAVEKFNSTTSVINAGINMVSAFQALHRKGYSYQDLNDGNFFINPDNGDVLICDNDNVAPYGESLGVGGKSRYMAPEVVLGKTKPNLDTDLFSLAVVLFMMFFISHPLEGARVVSCPCLTEENEKEFYANEPVFVYDPNNSSNRPVRGIHNNIINLWNLFPDYFQDSFIQSFTKGIESMNGRLMESEWKKIFYKLKDETILCHKCGEENFTSLSNNNTIECCECKNIIDKPLSLKYIDFEVALFPNKQITEWHSENGDYSKIIGSIVQNRKKPNLWGIRNLTDKMWLVDMPNNEQKVVRQNEVVPVLKGVSIDFGSRVANII